MKYHQVENGEMIYPRMRGYKFCCCDCGLVHVMDFQAKKWGRGYRIRFKVRRDNRATAAVRRHMEQVKGAT